MSVLSSAVELLPAEERRLLKWKMSSVTPNVVKHTIDRSHFKVTKSECHTLSPQPLSHRKYEALQVLFA